MGRKKTKMLSKATRYVIEMLEKEPQKVKEVIDNLNTLYDNRRVIIAQKEIIIKGIEGVEAMATTATSYFGSFLKKKGN